MFDLKCTEYIQLWVKSDKYYASALIGSGDSWVLYMHRPFSVTTLAQYGTEKGMSWDLIAINCTWDIMPRPTSVSCGFPCDVPR